MYYVYLLKSESDGSFYVGQTVNLQKRINKHNTGSVISTKGKRPWELVKYETFETRGESMWREQELKKSAHKRKKFYNN